MAWLEFSIQARISEAEALEDFLIEQGAQAVTIKDLSDVPIFEPDPGTTPLWDLNQITGLFDDSVDGEQLLSKIQLRFAEKAPKDFKLEVLEDRDWEREWLKYYESMCFGSKLWVVPSENLLGSPSLPNDISPEHVVLRLDPGLAFGTGTHETTSLCLQWLAQNDLKNKQVIDYGCGSGILGLAAHLLGAKEVIGCDLDPQAVIASHENARRNGIDTHFEMYDVPSFREIVQNRPKADLVLANILAGPLEKLCPELANLLDSGGIIVLSGVLKTQADTIKTAYQHYFTNIDIESKNDWIRLVATKQ